MVTIKNQRTGLFSKEYYKTITPEELGVIRIESLSANSIKPGLAIVNQTVDITASAKGKNLQYSFWESRGGSWGKIRDFSPENTARGHLSGLETT